MDLIAANGVQKQFKFLLWFRWTRLLNLTLVVLLCWLLARWTWVFFAPVPPAPGAQRPMPGVSEILDKVRSAHLFGTANGGDNKSTSAVAASTALDLRLSGVFAAGGKLPAVAIIKVENQGDLPFRSGDKVLSGVTLERVAPDHVMLRRGGVLERLDLEQKSPPIGKTSAPPQLKVNSEGPGKYSISSSELKRILSDPSQLADSGGLSAVPGQGVRIAEGSVLMSRLGLQKGDVISRINNRPVEQAADLFQGYREQLVMGGTVRVHGTRNGQSFEYNYALH